MKISELKGVGEKTEKLLNKLNIFSTEDLLKCYPRKYDVYRQPVMVSEMTDEDVYAVWGVVASACELNTRGRFKILTVFIEDEHRNRIKITWFNMPFLKTTLKYGSYFVFRGHVSFKGKVACMEQPQIFSYDAYATKMNSMQPVYPLTSGLTQNLMIKLMRQALDLQKQEPEFFSDSIMRKNELISHAEAVRDIHFPENMESMLKARKRLAFEEFFFFTVSVRALKKENCFKINEKIIDRHSFSTHIQETLEYSLTNAQKRVFLEMLKDMSGNRIMNRLVQGDVGSGKTILALLAMADVCESGFQSALMAPTEVLAKQHYEAFNEMFNKADLPVRVTLLTGSMTAKEKRLAKESIKNGETDIVIGTHAVITEDVEFKNLALVVTDEQHRFGVRQREALHNKGTSVHIMVMSATPIPRSLAIILYGDLDVSVVDEKPALRLPIKNCVVDDSYRKNAYAFMLKEIKKGHQIYIICAMAKEDEESDLENVKNYAEKIRKEFPENINIEYLHGKMTPKAKNEIMNSFAAGKIDILVSTTVVEVGVNVVNATVMMVENAERFGLAALHQLRGRVGRGKEQSYCIFVSNTRNAATRERLQILKDSNDGFYISEQDLKLRGPGDMFGTRQSGEFDFAIADIFTDSATLKLAAMAADKILSEDPDFSCGTDVLIGEKLKEYMKTRMQDINL